MRDNSKFTPERQQAYLDAIRRGVGKMQAARSVEMTHEGIRLFYKRNPEFQTARDDAEQECIDAVENALYKTAMGGNITAQIFFLCNRAPDRWQYRVHAHVLARNMSDQELIAQARKLFSDDEESGNELEMLEPNNRLLPLD